MSERKAYRVRQNSDNRHWPQHFTDMNTGHPYIAIPWPEDCPWRFGDFPLPDTEVDHESGIRLVVLGPPVEDVDGDWCVPVMNGYGVPVYEMASNIPSIWNARKDAEPEVVGTLEVVHGGFDTLDFDVPILKPGRYKIVREG